MASSMHVSDMSGMETRGLLVRSTVLLVPILETSFGCSFFFFALVLAYIYFIGGLLNPTPPLQHTAQRKTSRNNSY